MQVRRKNIKTIIVKIKLATTLHLLERRKRFFKHQLNLSWTHSKKDLKGNKPEYLFSFKAISDKHGQSL